MFDVEWLRDPEFSLWLSGLQGADEAYCKLCKKEISVYNGKSQLKAHAKDKIHKYLVHCNCQKRHSGMRRMARSTKSVGRPKSSSIVANQPSATGVKFVVVPCSPSSKIKHAPSATGVNLAVNMPPCSPSEIKQELVCSLQKRHSGHIYCPGKSVGRPKSSSIVANQSSATGVNLAVNEPPCSPSCSEIKHTEFRLAIQDRPTGRIYCPFKPVGRPKSSSIVANQPSATVVNFAEMPPCSPSSGTHQISSQIRQVPSSSASSSFIIMSAQDLVPHCQNERDKPSFRHFDSHSSPNSSVLDCKLSSLLDDNLVSNIPSFSQTKSRSNADVEDEYIEKMELMFTQQDSRIKLCERLFNFKSKSPLMVRYRSLKSKFKKYKTKYKGFKTYLHKTMAEMNKTMAEMKSTKFL